MRQTLTSITCLLAAALLASCASNDDAATAVGVDDVGASGATERFAARFVDGALLGDVAVVDCTLSGGTETTCYQIEIAGVPADSAVGPFCPPTVSASAAEGGVWLDGSNADPYAADGAFIQNLPNLYAREYPGSDWVFYDEQGEVNITDTQVACEAAARPDVDEAYQNFCVECSLDYYGGGVSQTVLVPTTPVPAASALDAGRGTVAVALNGAIMDAPAPVEAILSNFTIAAFDDCGGHVNPVAGYHYHAATGCTEQAKEADGHAGQIGFVLDGYALHGRLAADGSEPSDLDECRGHTDAERGYHYHAAAAGENRFIDCFSGETSAAGDDGGPGARGGQRPRDKRPADAG